MEINTVIIDLKDNVKEQLQHFIQSFDGDYSGENGSEYISEEAREYGYQSDVKYCFNIASKKWDDIKDVIEFIMKDLERTYLDYDGVGYSIEGIDEDKLLIVFAFTK